MDRQPPSKRHYAGSNPAGDTEVTMKNAEICDACRRELVENGNVPSIDKSWRLANIDVSIKFAATIDGNPADICRSCAEMIITGVVRKHLNPKNR